MMTWVEYKMFSCYVPCCFFQIKSDFCSFKKPTVPVSWLIFIGMNSFQKDKSLNLSTAFPHLRSSWKRVLAMLFSTNAQMLSSGLWLHTLLMWFLLLVYFVLLLHPFNVAKDHSFKSGYNFEVKKKVYLVLCNYFSFNLLFLPQHARLILLHFFQCWKLKPESHVY